ncbi:MAG: MFS transporter [Thermoplasmata archaeon]|nr:MFS transporter [Thermoplasmata archaeon]
MAASELGPPGSREAPPSATSLRSNRPFGLYVSGNTASWAGLGVADVLLLWLVFSETGSTLAVAAVGLAQAVPPIGVGFFAGVLADRYSRRRLLLLTSIAQAAVLALVPITLGAFGFQLWVVLVLVLALETATVVFRPSASAILPSLVESATLDSANAVTEAFTSVAATVGTAVAAVLVVAVGRSGSFAVDFGVFAVAAVFLAFVVTPRDGDGHRPVPSATPRAIRQELREVLQFLRGHAWMWQLTLVSVAASFFITMFSPYLVVYTVRVLHLTPNVFGYLIGCYSAGYFAGSLLAARLRVSRGYGQFFIAAVVGSGGLLSALVAFPYFVTAVVALALIGTLMGLVTTGFITLVQRTVPSELLGRFLGLDETLTWTIAPFGVVAGGLVAQTLGVRVGFAIAAAGLVAVGAIALASPSIRSLRQFGPATSGGDRSESSPPPPID